MSFERMVLALGVEPSPCSNLETFVFPLNDLGMERPAGLEPACSALEERCLNPLGPRRAAIWYRGRDRTLLRRFMGEGPPEGDPGIFGCGGRIRTCAQAG